MAIVIVTPSDRGGLLGLYLSTKVVTDWVAEVNYRWAMDNMNQVVDVLRRHPEILDRALGR